MERKELINDKKDETLFVKLFKIAVLFLAFIAICLIVFISIAVIKVTVYYLDISSLYLMRI